MELRPYSTLSVLAAGIGLASMAMIASAQSQAPEPSGDYPATAQAEDFGSDGADQSSREFPITCICHGEDGTAQRLTLTIRASGPGQAQSRADKLCRSTCGEDEDRSSQMARREQCRAAAERAQSVMASIHTKTDILNLATKATSDVKKKCIAVAAYAPFLQSSVNQYEAVMSDAQGQCNESELARMQQVVNMLHKTNDQIRESFATCLRVL